MWGLGGCAGGLWGVGGDAFCSDEESVAVAAVGGAGEEGEVVVAVDAFEFVGLVGSYDEDLVDAVGEGVAEDVDVDEVSDGEFGEPVEHGGVGHAGVPGEDGVGVGAADGQGCPVEVAQSRASVSVSVPWRTARSTLMAGTRTRAMASVWFRVWE